MGERVYHVTVMPCFDKKLEASREDFYDDISSCRDVDCVVTSLEIQELLDEEKAEMDKLEGLKLDCLTGGTTDLQANSGSGSGGFSDHVFRRSALEVWSQETGQINYKTVKNNDFQEVTLERDGSVLLKFAIANGFRNIQNLVQKMKRKRCDYDFVEIMACPSGCLNGGAQLRPEGEQSSKDLVKYLEEAYSSLKTDELPEKNPRLVEILSGWLDGCPDRRANLMRTEYHEVEKMTNSLFIKW